MKILGIETSCDETAVCIIEATGDLKAPSFKVLGDALYSQTAMHAEHGGVVPMLAKREHAKNLVPLLEKALQEAKLYHPGHSATPPKLGGEASPRVWEVSVREILSREPGLFESLQEFVSKIEKPDIDLISVTAGPGLEPALWVGITFAQALGMIWNIPVMPSNHMEGHILSPLLNLPGTPSYKQEGEKIQFPALALLISGGHTELVLMRNWMSYELIGQTRDDAIGEAFDKVARLMNLPYPGGPQISRLAAEARAQNIEPNVSLPRPMLSSDNFDFSFSGIKTAVLYHLQKTYPTPSKSGGAGVGLIPDSDKKSIAREFEDAVTEVIVTKVKKAIETYSIKTLIIGGGVIANTYIRENFKKCISEYPDVALLIPDIKLSTDNAVMIAMAGYLNFIAGKLAPATIIAEGNMSLSSKA